MTDWCRRPRTIGIVLIAALVAEGTLFGTLLQVDQLTHLGVALTLECATVPVWVVAVLAWRGVAPALSPRRAAALLLGVSAVFCALALLHRPTTSDDDYRYMWDAKVQLAGIDPYRYPPSAPQLAHLRDPSLFGAPDHCTHPFPGGCTSINRPTVRTVYPPVAQAAFDLVRILTFGGHGNHLPLQVAGALGSLLIGWLVLRRAGPVRAAVWAWCPVVVIEYANDAHIDWLATLLAVLAVGVAGRSVLAGALAGAATAVKIYPGLIVPSLMRVRFRAAIAAVVLVALLYVPHVVAVGTRVVGYLPGYLSEEQYGSGGRLELLGAVLPHPADTVVGLVLVVAVAVWAWLRGPRDDVVRSAVVVTGVAFAVFTPSYGWYAGLLIALVALGGAWEWLPIALAPSFVYLNPHGPKTTIWVVALVLALALGWWRRRSSETATAAAPPSGTAAVEPS